MLGEGFVRLSLILLLFEDAWSIPNVRLTVVPPAVVRRGTAALRCERDLQGLPLYAVKWYRGYHEFYRYCPSEEPKTRMFEVPGIFVDMHNSDEQQVTLHRMDLALAGNFSCEVTADGPSFSTFVAYKYIEIIALPERVPILVTEKLHYQPGELLRANCTSSASRPAANLTIFANDQPLTSSETQLFQLENGFQWTAAHAQLLLAPELFPGGRLRLRCLARVHQLYSDVATLELLTPDIDPRPEKITLPNGQSSSSATRRRSDWIGDLLLALFMFVFMFSPLHTFYKQHDFFGGSKNYYPESETNCLLGVSL